MEEPEKPTKRKDQIRHDEEVAQRLQAQMQAELKEEDRLVRQREKEANIVSWDNVQAMIDADYQMDQQMQAKEQEKLSIEEKSKFSKRAGEELEQESSKNQKLEEDKESEELKKCLEIVPDDGDDVTIDATLEDLETLYKLVKAKYRSTRPVEDLDLVLYGDLKIMFEPLVEDNVWKNQSDYRVLDWKLYDSCGVHSLRKQNVHIHMLVEKRYPLTVPTITDMLNRKLQADH
ncbi:hypothetical protein Tco_0511504 [Tanacetum coccineum]